LKDNGEVKNLFNNNVLIDVGGVNLSFDVAGDDIRAGLQSDKADQEGRQSSTFDRKNRHYLFS